MEPKSFSATAIHVAELCMARYEAEYISRGSNMKGTAASLGIAVHGALEMFVKSCFLNKTEKPSIELLLELFKMSYMTTFSTADTDTQDYEDGVEMLTKWYHRTIEYLSTVTILSCEVKENFPIKTSLGQIPYNYIFDRSDDIGNGEYKVVDYKTNRLPYRPEDLRKKIQVRAYGLAMQILHPDAKRIWVELDMLRHDGPIGVSLTRDDNISAWNYFKTKAQQIIDTKPDEVVETLNPECRFCVRKQSCEALKSNIIVGGVFGSGTAAELVDARSYLEYQRAAVEATIKELDGIILAEARETDVLEWESEFNKMSIGATSRRGIDAERVQMVIGDELFLKYGSSSITLANVEKLLKGKELTDQQKAQLRSLIYRKPGEAKIKVEPKNAIDAE